MQKQRETPYDKYREQMLRATAIHESAHAVMHCLMEVPLASVQMDEEGGGHVCADQSLIDGLFPYDFEDVAESQRRGINILLAGALAEAVYTRDWTTVQMNERIDFSAALKVMEESYFDYAESIKVINQQRFEALRLLMYPDVWSAIEAFSEILFARRRMTGKAATKIIKNSMLNISDIRAKLGIVSKYRASEIAMEKKTKYNAHMKELYGDNYASYGA